MDLNLNLKQLETLVNIDSGSHNAAGVNKVADVIEGWYRDLGWHVINHDVGPDAGSHVSRCAQCGPKGFGEPEHLHAL